MMSSEKIHTSNEPRSPTARDHATRVIQGMEEIARRKKVRKLEQFYPDEGPLRRELYRPHIAFFRAGAVTRERAIIAANRIGKSEGIGGYETSLHLTGLYPKWWQGKRFSRPTAVWACGSTGQTVRDIVQFKLLGSPGSEGTGMIPADCLGEMKKKAGSVPDAMESCMVKHVSGGWSRLVFKSYDQKRKAFEGTEQDVIWMDEEAPMDIYGECLIRTMTTGGTIMLTFTPLMGLTEVVLNYMPNGEMPNKKRLGMPADLIGGYKGKKFIVNATWDDAPHLTREDKEDIWAATAPHLRDARAKGIPQLGAGVIYPILQVDLECDDFDIPPWYPRAYALDVGWNATAAIWGAWDREADILYLYSCYKQGMREPSSHVVGIQARGDWIPGVIDPSAIGKGKMDGKRMIDEYSNLGLDLAYANNAVEAGIFAVWERMVTGRLKIFKSLTAVFNEHRIYRRNEKGKVAENQEDHLMDCIRYLVLSGLDVAATIPFDKEEYYYADERTRSRAKPSGYFGIY